MVLLIKIKRLILMLQQFLFAKNYCHASERQKGSQLWKLFCNKQLTFIYKIVLSSKDLYALKPFEIKSMKKFRNMLEICITISVSHIFPPVFRSGIAQTIQAKQVEKVKI